MTHSPLDQFRIKPVQEIIVGGWNLSITNATLFMFLSLLVVTILWFIGTRKRTLVPSITQVMPEMLYTMVENMIGNVVGNNGKRYMPLIFGIFLTVLAGNVIGTWPYAFTTTSHISTTFTLGFITLCSITIIGFLRHGLKFLKLFAPSGIPMALMPLMILIELISYSSRVISLSVRLMANMVAGHIMMKIFASFAVTFLLSKSWLIGLAVVPLSVNIILIGFELFIAALQAYIFTILSCIYLNDAVNLH